MLLCSKYFILSIHMHIWRKAIQNSRGNISESAESIVNMSYSQAEVYTLVNIRRVLTTCH